MRKLALLTTSLLCINANAIDLGVKGRLYDVIEIDLRIAIVEEMASKIDMADFKKGLEDSAEQYYRKLPVVEIPLSQKKETVYVDPTRVYEDDFWALEKAPNGKFQWYKAVEAGQEVNWLEHSISPMPTFFIFNYLSLPQRELAKSVIALNDPNIKVVFTGGDVKKANEELGYPLTHLNNALIREYDIKYTPTVVKRGAGEHQYSYRVTRFNMQEVSPEEVVAEIKGMK